LLSRRVRKFRFRNCSKSIEVRMIIYKDLFTSDELFSDASAMELLNGVVYKVKGKLRTDTFAIDDRAIGGNASAEGAGDDEGADATQKQGVDIVMNCRLVEYTLSKKDYMTHIKDYMKQVKTRLEEDKSPDKDLFQKNVQDFIKDVLANYKDYQLFCGESMKPEGMLALMKWDEETPYMFFFKHGLEAEKV
jgi:hypothetical protein